MQHNERCEISELASQLFKSKKFTLAETVLRNAMLASPQDKYFPYQLGGCYDRQARIEPDESRARTLFTQAAQAYKISADLDPSDFLSTYMTGFMFLRAQLYAQSVPYAVRAVRICKTDVIAWEKLALTCLGLNKPEAALKAFKEILQMTTERDHIIADHLKTLGYNITQIRDPQFSQAKRLTPHA